MRFAWLTLCFFTYVSPVLACTFDSECSCQFGEAQHCVKPRYNQYAAGVCVCSSAGQQASPPGPRITPGYQSRRKVYDNAGPVIDAYTKGLGNAPVSPAQSVAKGLSEGIELSGRIQEQNERNQLLREQRALVRQQREEIERRKLLDAMSPRDKKVLQGAIKVATLRRNDPTEWNRKLAKADAATKKKINELADLGDRYLQWK